MSDYWVTFRLRKDSEYDERYDALVGAVLSGGMQKYWDEPTSFYFVRTDENIDAFGARLAAVIDEDNDIVVIREIGVKNSRYAGSPDDVDFFEFLPDAKKL